MARIDWNGQYKRASIDQLVSHLASNQHRTFDDLLTLVLATADIDDPQHLRKLDDGERKYEEAVAALRRFRTQAEPLRGWRDEREQATRRREQERERNQARRALTEQMSNLRQGFQTLVTLPAQGRGYALEAFLTRLFEAFDIEAKGPFRLEGEQIDGAFTFQGNEFLVEAKWQDPLTRRADLDVFAQKIGRKLDNTLGLFVSVNGYEPTAVAATRGHGEHDPDGRRRSDGGARRTPGAACVVVAQTPARGTHR
ncbi:MAG: hypothetical protein KG028_15850 [Actinobacteria bacterium]|nr:hypothetical protein [Actinomycetota bacterium]